MQTGTGSATYQFFSSPEAVDPTPAYLRGLYFNAGQYLVSNTNLYLAHKVSVGMWIYVITAGDVFEK